PPALAARDRVQPILELGGEAEIGDVREEGNDEVVDGETEIRRHELLALAFDVAAVADRPDDRGVRRRPSDAGALELADQRRLREARWWLREVLRRPQIDQGKRLAVAQDGQTLVRSLGLVHFGFRRALVSALEAIHGEVTWEHELARAGAEQVAVPTIGGDVDGAPVVAGGRHLTRDETLPDQTVERQLAVQQAPKLLGRTPRVDGADRLVRFLRVLHAVGELPRLVREVFAPEALFDDGTCGGNRFRLDAYRVGPVVRDETGLVKRLCERHRLLARQPQARRRGLLERARRERRRGGALDRLFRLRHDPVVRPPQVLDRGVGGGPIGHLRLPAVDLYESGQERRAPRGPQDRVDRPVLPRHERADFAFALDDEPQRDRLDPTGRRA